MATSLYVVIATAGSRTNLLRRTLQSLSECEFPPCYGGTMIVENGQRNGVESLALEFADRLTASYRYVPLGNKSHALNTILNEVGAGLLCFLDDDVRMRSDLLIRYARAAEGIKQDVFFGGPVEVDYEVPPPEWLRSYLPPSAAGWRWNGGLEVASPVFLGFNWGAFAGDLRRLGGFDASRGPGAGLVSVGDETCMQQRMLAAGFRGRYIPEATVWHYVPADRCSPAWALERKYKQTISQTIEKSQRGELRGYGYYFARRFLVSPVRLALAAASRDEKRWFAARYWSSHRRGMLHGLQLARRWESHRQA